MKRRKTRCWKGYKPVKGKRPYSKGSCRKIKKNARRKPRASDLARWRAEARVRDDKSRGVFWTSTKDYLSGPKYDPARWDSRGVPINTPDWYKASLKSNRRRGLRRNSMSRIPTQQEYEMNELRVFRKQMQEVEELPLSERQENAREWFNDLMNDQKLIAERVGWLLNGSYGKGSFDSACRVLASPRMNQVAWCAITIANLEWRCPAKMAIESWKKLPVETRYIVNEAIRREIADAKAEGYCG